MPDRKVIDVFKRIYSLNTQNCRTRVSTSWQPQECSYWNPNWRNLESTERCKELDCELYSFRGQHVLTDYQSCLTRYSFISSLVNRITFCCKIYKQTYPGGADYSALTLRHSVIVVLSGRQPARCSANVPPSHTLARPRRLMCLLIPDFYINNTV